MSMPKVDEKINGEEKEMADGSSKIHEIICESTLSSEVHSVSDQKETQTDGSSKSREIICKPTLSSEVHSVSDKKETQTDGNSQIHKNICETTVNESSSHSDEEYCASSDENMDNEETISIEEAMGQEMDPDDELKLLSRDMEMSVEDVWQMHQNCWAEKESQAAAPKYMPVDQPGTSTSFSGETVYVETSPSEESKLKLVYEDNIGSADNLSEDDDYEPGHKRVPIGPGHQAIVSDTVEQSHSQEEASPDDHLMWTWPSHVTETELQSYVEDANLILYEARYPGIYPKCPGRKLVEIDHPLVFLCFMESAYVKEKALELLRSKLSVWMNTYRSYNKPENEPDKKAT